MTARLISAAPAAVSLRESVGERTTLGHPVMLMTTRRFRSWLRYRSSRRIGVTEFELHGLEDRDAAFTAALNGPARSTKLRRAVQTVVWIVPAGATTPPPMPTDRVADSITRFDGHRTARRRAPSVEALDERVVVAAEPQPVNATIVTAASVAAVGTMLRRATRNRRAGRVRLGDI